MFLSLRTYFFLTFFTACLFLLSNAAMAQVVINSDNNAGKANDDSIYATKEIPAVRLAQKKFTLKRRLYQNLVTRYNFYYNANLKFEEALQTVEASHTDDFTQLLSFYPYRLDEMSAIKGDLDSVILKASIGIEVHDPRSKWIDNLYLLIGKAYYFGKRFDDANQTFQFINLIFAPSRKDEYNTVIGSHGEGASSQISIATKEKQGGIFGRFRHIPSRNDALLWQIKNYIAMQDYDAAQSLLSTLQVDPNFPDRLQGQLAETQAYFYFVQQRYPDCVPKLIVAINKAEDNQLKARWEYILAQLYQPDKPDSAIRHFQLAAHYTHDPLMDFYSRLSIARLNINRGQGTEQQNLAGLLTMAHKFKYERYRAIIYHALATTALELHQPSSAEKYLLSSLYYNEDDSPLKVQCFDQLADLYYDQHFYQHAKNYYDSTAAVMGEDFPDEKKVVARKNALANIIRELAIVQRQDSLQRIANLPQQQRDSILQKIADEEIKALKRKQKEALLAQQSRPVNHNQLINNQENNSDEESSRDNEQQGQWYFYNQAAKSSGFTSFRQKWGDRPLADNWRRAATIKGFNAPAFIANDSLNNNSNSESSASASSNEEATIIARLATALPNTAKKLKASNDSVLQALYTLGSLYYEQLDDIPAAIATYEELLQRFPDNVFREKIYYSLYILYTRQQQNEKAAYYKNLLVEKFADSKYASMLRFGKINNPDSILRQQIMRFYDTTYEAYLSGKYDTVVRRFAVADSLYPHNFLQPKFDLLHAMILVKTTLGDTAKNALAAVIKQYPTDSVKQAAQDILNALAHKQEIENYLTNLKLDSAQTQAPVIIKPQQNLPPKIISQPVVINKQPTILPLTKDTVQAKTVTPVIPVKPLTPYSLNEKNPHFVIMLFKRTNKTLIENCNNSFSQYLQKRPSLAGYTVSPYAITQNETMLVFRLFKNEEVALNFLDEVRTDAPAVIPSVSRDEYAFYIISRDNFILLNQTKDLSGYVQFFNNNYVTQ